MPSTLTPNLNIVLLASGTTSWGTFHNTVTLPQLDGFSALASLAVVANDVSVTTGLSTSLKIRVNPGVFVSSTGAWVSYAGVTGYALAASSTIYVWLTDAGVLTTGAAFPSAGTKCVRLAVVTTGTATITSIVDARVALNSAG